MIEKNKASGPLRTVSDAPNNILSNQTQNTTSSNCRQEPVSETGMNDFDVIEAQLAEAEKSRFRWLELLIACNTSNAEFLALNVPFNFVLQVLSADKLPPLPKEEKDIRLAALTLTNSVMGYHSILTPERLVFLNSEGKSLGKIFSMDTITRYTLSRMPKREVRKLLGRAIFAGRSLYQRLGWTDCTGVWNEVDKWI